MASLAAAPSLAIASPCGRPDLLETFPPDGAESVPTNARLYAHYAPSAEYVNESVSFEWAGEAVFLEAPLVHFNKNESLLSIIPPEPLEPGKRYTVEWPELRGTASASRGRGGKVTFTAGSFEDTEAPRFEGALSVSWDVERERDECTDRLRQRYVFDIDLGAASDDGGRESLSLLIHQAEGPTIDQSEQVLLTSLPEDGTVRVARAIDDAVGRVCFTATVRDLAPADPTNPDDKAGKASASAATPVCVHTVGPPFFYGCRAMPAGSSARAADGWGLVMLAFIVSCARRARG